MKDVKWWHGLLIEEPSLHMAEGGGIDPISNLCTVSHLCPPEVSQIPVRDISENWCGFVECQVFLTTEGETWLWLASERVKKPFTVDTAHSDILRNLWKYPNDERVSKEGNDWARSYVVACLDRTLAVTWKHSRSAWQLFCNFFTAVFGICWEMYFLAAAWTWVLQVPEGTGRAENIFCSAQTRIHTVWLSLFFVFFFKHWKFSKLDLAFQFPLKHWRLWAHGTP